LGVTTQAPAPLQPPPQPAKLEPGSGFSLSASDEPVCTVVLQVPGQSIPAGLEVTRPEPLPVGETLTRTVPGGGGGSAEKEAMTLWSALRARSQVEVPEHAPCQPSNFQPASGSATSWTVAVASTGCWQSERQEKGGVVDRTSPLPVTLTCSACWAGPPPPPPPAGGGCGGGVLPFAQPKRRTAAIAATIARSARRTPSRPPRAS